MQDTDSGNVEDVQHIRPLDGSLPLAQLNWT